jgi:hypothetical protein
LTYASYCAAAKRASYGEIVFEIAAIDGGARDARGHIIPLSAIPAPHTWRLLSDGGNGTLRVQAGPQRLVLSLRSGVDSGDETVPSARSACRIKGTLFEHGRAGDGYEHQASYAANEVLASMLYSIVRIAGTANWNDK